MCRCGSVVVSRASNRSRKKGKFRGIFRDEFAKKSADFAGIFGANFTKSNRQKTANFVVIFKANFARNRSVLH